MGVLNHLLQIRTRTTFFHESLIKVSHGFTEEKWVRHASGEIYRDFGFSKLISSHDDADPDAPNCSCCFEICHNSDQSLWILEIMGGDNCAVMPWNFLC